MFGIKKTLTKWLMIIVGGVVFICIGVCSGCALAEKTEKHDDSVSISGDGVFTVDPLELMEAKAEAKVEAIRAKEEKWRLAVWIFGIGAIVVGGLALLVRSPFDYRKDG